MWREVRNRKRYMRNFFLIDEVRIVTVFMEGFTPCTIDDLEWLRDVWELD